MMETGNSTGWDKSVIVSCTAICLVQRHLLRKSTKYNTNTDTSHCLVRGHLLGNQ